MRLSTFYTTQAVSSPCPSSRCIIGQNWLLHEREISRTERYTGCST